MNESSRDGYSFQPFQPTAKQVQDLINAAHSHPLGLEFLLEGDLAAVAVTFGAHAFTVEAARDQLKEAES